MNKIRADVYPQVQGLQPAAGAFRAKAPSSKHQAPGKLQIPSSNRAALPRAAVRLRQPEAGPSPHYFKAAVEVWSLVFPWSLVFGAWMFFVVSAIGVAS